MENDTEKKLKQIRVKDLSDHERGQLWQSIQSGIQGSPQTHSYSFNIFNRKPMINIALILILLFGGSIATVSAADKAKPGDLLFPVDRAIEDIQLKFSSDEKKTELKLKFALERVEEVEEIIDDTAASQDDSDYAGIADDSATTTSDTGSSSDSDNDERVETAFSTALEFLADVRRELEEKGNDEAIAAIDSVVERLDGEIDSLKGSVKLKVEGEKDKYKLELKFKDENGKQEIKIEMEGDELEIESEIEKEEKGDHEDVDEDEDHDDEDVDESDDDRGEKKEREDHDEDNEDKDRS